MPSHVFIDTDNTPLNSVRVKDTSCGNIWQGFFRWLQRAVGAGKFASKHCNWFRVQAICV